LIGRGLIITGMSNRAVLELKPEGLYSEAGDFYIDPWRPVERAVITHAHADHARPGMRHYLVSNAGMPLYRSRLGVDASLDGLDYGETITLGSAKVSLHPAGHVLGSAQVRVETGDGVWVASGDYKLGFDPTCTSFEPVKCDTFITESTFGLPIFRWQNTVEIWAEIVNWWQSNADAGRASVLYCYSLGKAQRVLAGMRCDIGPIITHGAVAKINDAYAEAGVGLPTTQMVSDTPDKASLRRTLVLAPPGAAGSTWLKRFEPYTDAFASGWMAVRGIRRRRGCDTGFVLSDHADWSELLTAINASGAQRVLVTHGYVDELVHHLRDIGLNADGLATEFEGEDDGAVSSTV
jgi:putative mRNA 3-end processing factor